MSDLKHNLLKQLISITILILVLIFVSLRLFLPKVLLPIYEKNVYQNLNQPMSDVTTDEGFNELIAYVYVTKNEIVTSQNYQDVVSFSPKLILDKINSDHGKFTIKSKTYYYVQVSNSYITKIIITNDTFTKQVKYDVLTAIFPIMIATFLIILALIGWWTHNLVLKIQRLKEKIDNLDNAQYVDNYYYQADDELKVLSDAIDNMKETLKEQEEYKNQMYQNISHDFKTPLTVIKSYIEAIKDGIQTKEEGLKIIE